MASVGSVLIRSLSATWRLRIVEGTPPTGPVIYAFLHGDQALLYHAFRHRKIVIPSSLSRDGEIQARILKRFGYGVVRGSSHRGGGRALFEMARWIEEGWSAALAVDGPRGPAGIVKPGVVTLAQRTGRPIVPGAARAQWRKILSKAWDRYQIPLPGTRGVIVLGDPIPVASGEDSQGRERIRVQVEEQLKILSQRAEELLKSPHPNPLPAKRGEGHG
ncbi:MAG: lysophospholipid acyltransferase family protein [Deltaproteobacteria bacterium]|nr:lysophospholipid acyltransferase family protein [Deltaproteobacteria bacterium]